MIKLESIRKRLLLKNEISYFIKYFYYLSFFIITDRNPRFSFSLKINFSIIPNLLVSERIIWINLIEKMYFCLISFLWKELIIDPTSVLGSWGSYGVLYSVFNTISKTKAKKLKLVVLMLLLHDGLLYVYFKFICRQGVNCIYLPWPNKKLLSQTVI